LFIVWCLLWGNIIKLLVWLEVVRLGFIIVLSLVVLLSVLTSGYFFLSLIFLVCESSLGFIVFIIYSCFSFDIVKNINLIEF